MDYLRDGIGLRGLAQKDPLNEYRSEGFVMFQELQGGVRSEVVNLLLHVEVEPGAFDAPDDLPPGAEGEEVDGNGGGAGSLPSRGSSWASGSSLTYSAGGGATAIQEAKAELGEGPAPEAVVQQRIVGEKVGRNDPCPCGSGKKYKACHGR
jgi:preprotein translocase subunit SecA